MDHLTKIVADSLRNARHAKGFNQRELSARSGVPQGHISKIENGAVDLRASSLVALARALDLELMLVPRKSVSAVQSIAGNASAGAAQDGRAARQVHRELSRLQAAIDNLSTDQMSRTEVAQFQRDVRELGYFRPAMIDLQAIRHANRTVKAFSNGAGARGAFRQSMFQLRTLRDVLAQGRVASDDTASVRPAYSLGDDEIG